MNNDRGNSTNEYDSNFSAQKVIDEIHNIIGTI